MRIYITLCIALCSLVSFSQTETDWSKMKLKGKVQSIMELDQQLEENGDIFGSDRTDFFFNKKGYIDSTVHYGKLSPNSYSRKHFIYDEEWKLINTVHFIYIDGVWDNYTLSDWRRQKMFYNSTGKLIKIKEINQDTVLVREVKYKYDEQGRLIKKTDNDLKGSKSAVTKIKYSSTGSEEALINAKRKYIKTYDMNGIETSTILYWPKDSKEYSETKNNWVFDSHKNWVKKNIHSRNIDASAKKSEWLNDNVLKRTITYYE